MDDMMKTRGGEMGGKEWRRWIVVGWLWIPNVMAEAECCRKMNPMPRWPGSSSSCFIHLMTQHYIAGLHWISTD
jgi:hypothetical protein